MSLTICSISEKHLLELGIILIPLFFKSSIKGRIDLNSKVLKFKRVPSKSVNIIKFLTIIFDY